MIKDDWRSRFRKAAFIFILDPLFQLDGTSSFWFAKGYPTYKDLIEIGDEKLSTYKMQLFPTQK